MLAAEAVPVAGLLAALVIQERPWMSVEALGVSMAGTPIVWHEDGDGELFSMRALITCAAVEPFVDAKPIETEHARLLRGLLDSLIIDDDDAHGR
jgi:hypothetical protein